ncbi:undecaprenyl-diphosphate phosphatase [Pantanalinema rosaneae]|uniref:undecaprenyl-diphosphate phosphatase n=1 Tax=Pantanalinema rosaneae TaxID=1620701 RepID=UPI003D6EB4F6
MLNPAGSWSGWSGVQALVATVESPAAVEGSNLLIAVLQAFALGIVQGITEFLPISSTAHLLIFRDIFHWTQQKYFVDAIQFGSVIAVVMYFWQDIRQIVLGGWVAFRRRDWEQEEWKLLVGIAVGTLPALLMGFLLKDLIPESPAVIAIASLIMASLLGLAERVGTRKRRFRDLQILDGLLVGVGQTLALVPGSSRSGSTLTAALFLGLERQTAARFSFLLGIPTLTIATLYQARKAFDNLDSLLPMLVGIVSSFIFSYIAIAWLLRFLQRQSTWVFVWYRLAFGITLLSAIALGWLKNS